MAKTVFDPRFNTTHSFPDDASPEEMESAMSRGVPVQGAGPSLAQAALPILGQVSQQLAQPAQQSALPDFRGVNTYGMTPNQVTTVTDQVMTDKFSQMKQKLIQQQQLKDEMEREKDRAATIKLETQRTKNQFAIQKAKIDAEMQKQKLEEQKKKLVTAGGAIGEYSQAEGYQEIRPAPDKLMSAQGGIYNTNQGSWVVPPREPKGSGAKEEKPVQMKRIVIAPDGSQVEETFWDYPSKYTAQSPLKSQKPPSASSVPKPGDLSDIDKKTLDEAMRRREEDPTPVTKRHWLTGDPVEYGEKQPLSFYIDQVKKEMGGFGQPAVPGASTQQPVEGAGAYAGKKGVLQPDGTVLVYD